MKKCIISLIVVCFALCFCGAGGVCYADEGDEQNLEQELGEMATEQISSLDFSELQEVLDKLGENEIKMFGSTSFFDKVTRLINGDFGGGFSSFFDAFIKTMFGDILGFVPLLCTTIIITILCSIISSLKSDKIRGVGEVVNFVCFGAVAFIISAIIVGVFTTVKETVSSMQTQMSIMFPMLLTFLASVGGTVSVGIYQPAVAILSQVVVSIFMFILMPVFVFIFVLTIVNNFTHNIKLEKMIDFFKSTLKWISTITFGAFLGVLGIQGIVAGSFDGVSIKMTKFALKSYVPILGGYLSDGFNVAMAGSILVKNAVGVSGIILLLSSILSPVVSILSLMLMLKLCSAILEPTTNSNIPNFLHQTSKLLGLILMILLGVAFMYVITVGLILCTANVF